MNKYRNIKFTLDGITFHSKREAMRYNDLKLLERAGQIRNLTLQPKFVLLDDFMAYEGANKVLKKMKGFSYIADFMYQDVKYPQWEAVVEDVKGVKTAVYLIKKKLFLAKYSRKYLFIET